MLARNVLRAASLARPHQARRLPQSLPFMMQQARNYAASVTIKVPQMAESISEGTLKQFTKQVGDYVEMDEELATIETDKVSSASSIPLAGGSPDAKTCYRSMSPSTRPRPVP